MRNGWRRSRARSTASSRSEGIRLMSMINYASREINCKLVYYGPGLGGKTTNLEFVYNKVAPAARGKMISLATETERTLFFDFLPVDLGTIRGFNTRFHLYTVPGQVYYNASRKLIHKGVDGVVFVADSQVERMDANIAALQNLYENLADYGYDPQQLPIVIQYNKRDLPNIVPEEEMRAELNPDGLPDFEAVAVQGIGGVDTLKAVSKHVLKCPGRGAPGAAAAQRSAERADGPARLARSRHLLPHLLAGVRGACARVRAVPDRRPVGRLGRLPGAQARLDHRLRQAGGSARRQALAGGDLRAVLHPVAPSRPGAAASARQPPVVDPAGHLRARGPGHRPADGRGASRRRPGRRPCGKAEGAPPEHLHRLHARLVRDPDRGGGRAVVRPAVGGVADVPRGGGRDDARPRGEPDALLARRLPLALAPAHPGGHLMPAVRLDDAAAP